MKTQQTQSPSFHTTQLSPSQQLATTVRSVAFKDTSIRLEEAGRLTERYRQNMLPGSRKGGFFGRNIIEKILAQEDCFGIRAYFAAEENTASTLVLVGLDASYRELTKGVLGEDVLPCPPYCAAPNALNDNVPSYIKVRSSRHPMFTGDENHRITLAEAKRLVGNSRTSMTMRVVGADLSSDSLMSMLMQEECAGIRVYFGLHSTETPSLIFVGANAVGDDLLSGPIVTGLPVRPTSDPSFNGLG